MLSTCPERKEVMKTPRKFVAGMCVDGLEQTQGDPEVDGEDVEIVEEHAPKERGADSSNTQQQNLNRRCVFGGKAEWCSVCVVDLVHASVERSPMERTV